MKKRNVFLMTALIAMVCITSCGVLKKDGSSVPGNDTGIEDATDAENKARIKEWKSEGYKLTGAYSTFTWEKALATHNKRISGDSNNTKIFIPVQGSASASELSSAKMFSANDAAIQYGQRAGSSLKGSINREAANISDESTTNIVAAFTQKITSYIVPYMKESFGMERSRGNKVEVIFYYIVGEDEAKTAGKRALEEVDKEQAVGLKIENYVNDLVPQ
jgi:hypothetical protein